MKEIHVLEGLQQAEPLRMLKHVLAAINKDQRLAVQELESDLGIPKSTVSEILT